MTDTLEMDNELDTLLVDVRAATGGFAQDIRTMRASLDTQLIGGFEQAGSVLERGLASALRKGTLGFADLGRMASQVLDQIAGQALQLGLDSLFGPGAQGGLGGAVGGLLNGLFGLPGRATGGPVSPGRGYVVGERGPELFVPTSAGRVEANPGIAPPRDVRVAISLNTPRGTDAPVALQRSSRQVAAQVRRALL